MDKCVRTERISNEEVLLEAIISYHGISKLTIAKMAGVEEKEENLSIANQTLSLQKRIMLIIWLMPAK